jgi:hypothetical protein
MAMQEPAFASERHEAGIHIITALMLHSRYRYYYGLFMACFKVTLSRDEFARTFAAFVLCFDNSAGFVPHTEDFACRISARLRHKPTLSLPQRPTWLHPPN